VKQFFAIGIAILVIICLIDLPRARRINQTLYGFFLVNGSLKLRGFIASVLSANLSIGNFLIFVTVWGYTFGWGGIFWFVVNLLFNVFSYLLFMPAFRSYIEDSNNSGTIHEFLSSTFASVNGNNYSRRIRLISSATTITGLLFAIVFELHLSAEIAATILNFDPIVIFAVMTAIICIYSGIGGFHTLVFTDITQSFAMIAGLIAVIPILFSLNSLPTANNIFATYPLSLQSLNIGMPAILGICIIGSGWFLVAMDQWQRTCATRDSKRTRNGMIWYFVSISGFAVVFGLVGMITKSALYPSLPLSLSNSFSQGLNPLTDLFLGSNLEGAPVYLYAIVGVALMAAAMSTANTFLIVCGHSFVSDVLIALSKNIPIGSLSNIDSKSFVAIARSSIIGMGVLVVAIWLALINFRLMVDPYNFFFIAYSVQFGLLAPMVVSRLPKRYWPSADAIFLSIVVGFISSIVLGFGLWSLIQKGLKTMAGVGMIDWLTLTPVLTFFIGSIILFAGIIVEALKRKRKYLR